MFKTFAIALLFTSLIGANQAQSAECTFTVGDNSASCSGYVDGSYINGDVDDSGRFTGTIDGQYVTCTQYGGCY
jgi:hypothetical protein